MLIYLKKKHKGKPRKRWTWLPLRSRQEKQGGGGAERRNTCLSIPFCIVLTFGSMLMLHTFKKNTVKSTRMRKEKWAVRPKVKPLTSVGHSHTSGQREVRCDMCPAVLSLGFELYHPTHTSPRANGSPRSSIWPSNWVEMGLLIQALAAML